jgi:lipid A 4'-phosphatase
MNGNQTTRDDDFKAIAANRSRKALIYGGISATLLAAIFFSFPALDLIFSGLFYDSAVDPYSQTKKGFWLSHSETLKFIFWLIDVVARMVLVGALAITFYQIWRRHAMLLASSIVTASLVLGPAITVNSIFKEHWDRARPRQIIDFGGDKKFSAAWVISDQCKRNCSFTSGHAAAGFSFVVGHFVSRTPIWLWLGVISGLLIGLARIAVGAHFLSDVVFSFFVVYLVAALVTLVFIKVNNQRNLRKYG